MLRLGDGDLQPAAGHDGRLHLLAVVAEGHQQAGVQLARRAVLVAAARVPDCQQHLVRRCELQLVLPRRLPHVELEVDVVLVLRDPPVVAVRCGTRVHQGFPN